MYRSDIDTDSQEITRIHDEHAEILRIRKRRQKTLAPVHLTIAMVLTATSLLVWGIVIRDAHVDDGYTPASRAYLAFLSFAIVLGIASSAAAVLWASVYNTRRIAADGDRLREHDQARLMKTVKDAMAVFLAEGDASAREAMARAQQLLDGTQGGTVTPFSRRG